MATESFFRKFKITEKNIDRVVEAFNSSKKLTWSSNSQDKAVYITDTDKIKEFFKENEI